MIACSALITACFLIFMVNRSGYQADVVARNVTSDTNTLGYSWNRFWISFIDDYGLPFAQSLVSAVCGLYFQLTFANLAIFTIKFVPSGYYTFKSLRYFYRTSQERIKQKQIELEDLQLQITIVKEKLSVRDSEISDLESQLRCDAEKLRKVRAHVRRLLATDTELRRALGAAAPWPGESEPADCNQADDDEEDPEYIMALLEEMKGEPLTIPEKLIDSQQKCGESGEPNQSEESFHSSPEDCDVKQECRVKIVKVTNVYKVAYLRQYIKQKKMRRASQQALLKKKIENIKKLLDSWQKSLNMVINSKLLYDTSNTISEVSENIGDYSKPNVRESGSETNLLKNNEHYYDEYRLGWAQNLYRNYNNLSYNYEEGIADETIVKDFNEEREYNDLSYPTELPGVCECNIPPVNNQLFILPEETISQIAIEENNNDEETESDSECRDTIAV